MPYGNRNSRSHKSSSSIIGLLSYSAELEIFYIFFVIMWDCRRVATHYCFQNEKGCPLKSSNVTNSKQHVQTR